MVIFMRYKNWILPVLLLLILAAAFLPQPASANPAHQVVYQTPTALPDGRILYIVQENDSCLRIQLLTGTTVEQLRDLNKLNQDCTISVGKELLLGIFTPEPSPTPNPQFTATALLPTPTTVRGMGILCLLLYNDINGNGFQEENEALLGGGAVSIADRSGQTSFTGLTKTDPVNPFCQEVPEGEYNVSIAIPDGYNPTTNTSLRVPVQAGNQGFADFGAQVSARAVEAQPPGVVGGSSTNPVGNNLILALMGGLLLLMGGGLGIYVLTMRR
jgi:hypothetical protein